MPNILSSFLDKIIHTYSSFFEDTPDSINAYSLSLLPTIQKIDSLLKEHNLTGMVFGSSLFYYYFDKNTKVKDIDVLILDNYSKHKNIKTILGLDDFRMVDTSNDNHKKALGYNGYTYTMFQVDRSLIDQAKELFGTGLYIPPQEFLFSLYHGYTSSLDISQYRLSQELYNLLGDYSIEYIDIQKNIHLSFLSQCITPIDADKMIQYFRLEDIVFLEHKTLQQMKSLLSSKVS